MCVFFLDLREKWSVIKCDEMECELTCVLGECHQMFVLCLIFDNWIKLGHDSELNRVFFVECKMFLRFYNKIDN